MQHALVLYVLACMTLHYNATELRHVNWQATSVICIKHENCIKYSLNLCLDTIPSQSFMKSSLVGKKLANVFN